MCPVSCSHVHVALVAADPQRLSGMMFSIVTVQVFGTPDMSDHDVMLCQQLLCTRTLILSTTANSSNQRSGNLALYSIHLLHYAPC